MGIGVGNLYGMLDSFLNPQKGYQKGQEQLDKYYGEGQNYLQPYNQQGQDAYGQLNGAVNNLLNPSQLYDQFMNNYQQSDASKFAQERAMNQGNRVASSMGILGSTPALQAIQAGTSEIGAQDEQKYLERMINQYLQGANLAQGIYGTGAQAATQQGQNAIGMGNNSAQMAYGKQNAPGELFGGLLGTAASLGGSYMGMQGMNNMANAWNTNGGGISGGQIPSYLTGAASSGLPSYLGGTSAMIGGL